MTKPTPIFATDANRLKLTVEKLSFEHDGDLFERAHHAEAKTQLPNMETFWRQFVVPLTNRLTGEGSGSKIRFRDGVDPLLQYICGANYSLFVHLVSARNAVTEWNSLSLDSVFTRLASSCDVFEVLAIKLHVLLCECASQKSQTVDDLTKEQFLKEAEKYYDEKYPSLKEHYLSIGKKVPPIYIPTKQSLFDEFLNGAVLRKKYHTTAGQIRSFRNAIVHDVRVGMLKAEDGRTLVPKPETISKYRNWFEVERASADPESVRRDFREVKEQCDHYIVELTHAINGLYGDILSKFSSEFYSEGRVHLRELFGVVFGPVNASIVQNSPGLENVETEHSHSFATKTKEATTTVGVSGHYPIPPQKAPERR
jgi:hypothetical protein